MFQCLFASQSKKSKKKKYASKKESRKSSEGKGGMEWGAGGEDSKA
jgi:hypothetical protein